MLGRKCAAGWLIPDDLYRESMECNPVQTDEYRRMFTANENEVTKLIRELGHDIVLVRKLQVIHDNKQICEWESEWRILAFRNNLTMPEGELV